MFGPQSTTGEVLAGIDLSGKQAIVTGASTGLGLETARALAAAGAEVVLASRDLDRTLAAAAAVRDRVPHAHVEARVLDLADLDRVREFAAGYLQDHDRLDLLINNAGVMFTPFERSAQGFEIQLAVNHLGHFLLTCLLAPALVRGAPSRVVNLSSGGHFMSNVLWDDMNFEHRDYDKFVAYGQSKTANILFTVELDRRLGASGVHAYAVHPGMITTDLGRHLPPDEAQQLLAEAKKQPGAPEEKSVEQGAATSVWAATAPDLEQFGGSYLADCQVSDQHARWALDPAAAERLWTMTETLVGEPFALGDSSAIGR